MASVSLLQHSASLPASTVAHTTPPAQRVPQRQPPRTRETLQVRDCFNMSLADIMKHEHFLSNLRKPGLVRILNLLQAMQPGRHLYIGSSKDDLIDAIVTRSAPALPVAVTKLLNDNGFLDQLTVHGLDLIQSSLGWRNDGNHAAKKNCILQHLPLDITIADEFGTYQKQITRAQTVCEFLANAHNNRHRVSVDGGYVETRDLRASLGSLGFNDGCTVSITNRYNHEEAMAAMGSNDMQIFVKNLQKRDVTFIVQPSMNIATLRVMVFEDARVPLPEGVSGPGDLRLLFGGKQLEDDKKILDYNITKESTLHLVQRVRGGAPKGVRKVTKQEKLHKVRAAAQYSVTQYQLHQGMDQVCQQIAQGAYINATLASLNLQQLEALNNDCKDITRNDRVGPAIITHLVPQVAQLEMEKERINNSIQALKDSFEIAMVENYFQANAMDTEPFYEALEIRLSTERDAERNRQQQAQLQQMHAQLAAQQQAPADSTMGS